MKHLMFKKRIVTNGIREAILFPYSGIKSTFTVVTPLDNSTGSLRFVLSVNVARVSEKVSRATPLTAIPIPSSQDLYKPVFV